MNAGSPRRPGINLDSSIHQSDAFPHTDETKPLTVHGGADIKSPARIVDVQMNVHSFIMNLLGYHRLAIIKLPMNLQTMCMKRS